MLDVNFFGDDGADDERGRDYDEKHQVGFHSNKPLSYTFNRPTGPPGGRLFIFPTPVGKLDTFKGNMSRIRTMSI